MKYDEEIPIGILIAIIIFSIAVWFATIQFYFWLYFVIAVKIFELPQLTFWQFIGFKILCESLFKGCNIGSSDRFIKINKKEN